MLLSQELFELILTQLRGLEDVDSPSFTRYCYLLERCVVPRYAGPLLEDAALLTYCVCALG